LRLCSIFNIGVSNGFRLKPSHSFFQLRTSEYTQLYSKFELLQSRLSNLTVTNSRLVEELEKHSAGNEDIVNELTHLNNDKQTLRKELEMQTERVNKELLKNVDLENRMKELIVENQARASDYEKQQIQFKELAKRTAQTISNLEQRNYSLEHDYLQCKEMVCELKDKNLKITLQLDTLEKERDQQRLLISKLEESFSQEKQEKSTLLSQLQRQSEKSQLLEQQWQGERQAMLKTLRERTQLEPMTVSSEEESGLQATRICHKNRNEPGTDSISQKTEIDIDPIHGAFAESIGSSIISSMERMHRIDYCWSLFPFFSTWTRQEKCSKDES